MQAVSDTSHPDPDSDTTKLDLGITKLDSGSTKLDSEATSLDSGAIALDSGIRLLALARGSFCEAAWVEGWMRGFQSAI